MMDPSARTHRNAAVGEGSRPDLHAAHYLAFTPDHNEDLAAATFAQRYGRPPQWIVEDRGLLFVGPVPAQRGNP